MLNGVVTKLSDKALPSGIVGEPRSKPRSKK
jgi:hypothetical protein